MLADGKIYVTNEEGLTTVVAAGPKFEVLAENPLNDYSLSSPAISDGRIYIRDVRTPLCDWKKINIYDSQLICIICVESV